jgi:YtoQ family protein
MNHPELNIYLAGEVHTDWRDQITEGVLAHDLPVTLTSANTDHPSSDACGACILGAEDQSFWHDHKGAKLNAIRTRTLISRADIVVARFGPKYRQWNSAFDAGLAVAQGASLITLHAEDLDHALKEVDSAALAVARTPQQVVSILIYIVEGRLVASSAPGVSHE